VPESTLRYYETIGLIGQIKRDTSSKHRVYSDDDVNVVIAVACLNATGLSIEDMRAYLKNRNLGAEAANEQVKLLKTQKQRLAHEAYFIKLRQRYVDTKIAYWKAVESGDKVQVRLMKRRAEIIAKGLKAPKTTKVED
jgi:DNA-binding transcriptional MerR regulator